MAPPPRDFTRLDPNTMSVEHMVDAVKRGRPGTAMQAFDSVLSARDIHAVVSFIRAEFMFNKRANTRYHSPKNGWPKHERYRSAFPFALGELTLDFPIEKLTDAQKAGRALYLSTCVGCHERGRLDSNDTRWETRALSFPRNGQTPGSEIDAISAASPFALHEKSPTTMPSTVIEQNGEKLFADNCAFCHGRDGSGKNWIGSFVEPHAADIASDPKIVDMAASELRERIKNGVKGSAMPAWKYVLSDAEIEEIIAYLRLIQQKNKVPRGAKEYRTRAVDTL